METIAEDKLKKAIVRSNSLKKKKMFRKQKKVSIASLKLVSLHSWLGSETESTGDNSGEDTEILLSSDSECEHGKDLPGKCLSKRPSQNVVEIEESTQRKEGHSPSIEVSDDKENEATCSITSSPPHGDQAESDYFLTGYCSCSCSSSSCFCSNSLEHNSGDVGVFETYKKYVGQNLTNNISRGGAYISHIKDMSLSESQAARKLYCQHHHVPSCLDTCLPLVNAAKEIECQCIVKLQTLFCNHFKFSLYKTDKAIRRLMQLPVVF